MKTINVAQINAMKRHVMDKTQFYINGQQGKLITKRKLSIKFVINTCTYRQTQENPVISGKKQNS